MTDEQAKGYIFEEIVLAMLKKHGYVDVKKCKLRGRGAEHQIDAHGILTIPTPFMYPLRLLCEVKCRKNSIGLESLRNFVGVIKDISENYIIGARGQRNTPNRYTDTGCFFSIGDYTKCAQEYAWAHNIFIISFNNITSLTNIADMISSFVDDYPKGNLGAVSIKQIINDFYGYNNMRQVIGCVYSDVGIFDGVYPVVLVGNHDWLANVNQRLGLETDSVDAVKVVRFDSENDTRFDLSILGNDVYFVLPKMIAMKVIERIKATAAGGRIFHIDVPFISKRNESIVRRMFKLDIRLPREDMNKYIEDLNNFKNEAR